MVIGSQARGFCGYQGVSYPKTDDRRLITIDD